jgi:hypothetical protein
MGCSRRRETKAFPLSVDDASIARGAPREAGWCARQDSNLH